MLFADIIGQEEVKNRLRAMVQSGRLPHAQLFCGIEGAGKLPLALAYAQYVCCKHRTESDSCGVCPSCVKFAKLAHPDLHLVFPFAKNESKKQTSPRGEAVAFGRLMRWKVATHAKSLGCIPVGQVLAPVATLNS